MKPRSLTLDLRVGGLGDNWMRLVGYYVVAGLRPAIRLRLVLPAKLAAAARCGFGDRLDIVTEPTDDAIAYAVRGLRDLIGPAIRGRRFVSPYGRVVLHDWNRWNLKDRLNSLALSLADGLGWVYSPPWASLAEYQGYSEVVTVPDFRDLRASDFNAALERDFQGIFSRLQEAPCSPEFTLPPDLSDKVMVFPTGTAYQFIPLEWALKNLPDAVFAFFHRDPDWEVWRAAGLRTVAFYTEPGDMLALSKVARVTLSTDSFPSHFLQFSTSRLVVLLTEVPRHRIVAPCFKGAVIEATAPCHPCPHLERKAFPRCKAGRVACLNWESPHYRSSIMRAIA